MTSPLATNKKEEIINLINQVLGAEDKIDRNIFYQEIEKNINPDLSTEEIFKVVLLTATSLLEKDILDKRLLEFDLAKLSQSLTSERDKLFNYLGLETLTGRYLLRRDKTLYEAPQFF